MQVEAVKERVYEGRPGFPTEYGPDRQAAQPGLPFWPHEAYRDLVIVFLLCAILLFLSAAYTPIVGPPANPAIQPFIVPDWYLLFSWGLLKVADVFPTGQIPDGLGGTINVDGAFWGDVLTLIPVLPIFLLPFLDRGREARPAKAPVRGALGLYGMAFVFFASLYALNDRLLETWPFLTDDALKWFFIVPPILVGLAAYIGLRRLGFRDMYWWLVVALGAAFALILAAGVWAFAVGPWGADGVDPWTRLLRAFGDPRAHPLIAFGLIPIAYTGAVFYATAALRERKAKEVVLVASLIAFFAAVGAAKWYGDTQPVGTYDALRVIAANGNFFIALPLFALVTFYVGTRTPYSTYEYLLNECYQCGKCHTVCPVTKVEDDALGGLNLVYNTFKKQHDGVPLWTCLACDACSAVCPLDIHYSDYILEERSKVLASRAEAPTGSGAPVGAAK